MNFFEHQQEARRQTLHMRLLFIPAVAGVAAVTGAVIAVFQMLVLHHDAPVFDMRLFLWASAASLVLVLAASVRETLALRKGGRVIAAYMGARRVSPLSENPRERQLLNVAEEMALAAGMRVPDLYLLEHERGINAFAAGLALSDSVVVITQGMLDTLNRDEMQGVLGHELSHILNGDSALNTRMTGLLAGLIVIADVGRSVWAVAAKLNEAADRTMFASLREADLRLTIIVAKVWLGVRLFILLVLYTLGLCLYVVGYLGSFLAQVIKASVSRQREFLADASAVQFTRDPDGIASALYQIAECLGNSYIDAPYAETISHMFFGAVVGPLRDWPATHPPTEERIERINPRFKPNPRRRKPLPLPVGEAPGVPKPMPPEPMAPVRKLLETLPQQAQEGIVMALAGAGLGQGEWRSAVYRSAPESPVRLAGAVGDVRAARRLIDALPRELYAKTRLPGGACAVVLAVMLSRKPEILTAQLRAVRELRALELARNAEELEESTRDLPANFRLPLVDLALPAIRSAGEDLRISFLKALEAVIHAGKRISPLEFSVMTLMRFQVMGKHGRVVVQYDRLKQARHAACWLLSMMAHAGAQAPTEEERKRRFDAAFAAGAQQLVLGQAEPVGRDGMTLDAAEAAMAQLRKLAPIPKGRLVAALFASILEDGKIMQAEVELMRMVCAVLECPLPPLFDGPDVARVQA